MFIGVSVSPQKDRVSKAEWAMATVNIGLGWGWGERKGFAAIGEEELGICMLYPLLTQRILGSHTDSPSGPKLLLVNARSVKNKTMFIHDLILNERANLACITKRWVEELFSPPSV